MGIFNEKDQMKSIGLAYCDLGVDGAKAVADYVGGTVIAVISVTHINYHKPFLSSSRRWTLVQLLGVNTLFAHSTAVRLRGTWSDR